jgi:hypothetical protein
VLPHRIHIAMTYSLFIHEIISQKHVQGSPLAIDNGGSPLVVNMQYHSQTVFVMQS